MHWVCLITVRILIFEMKIYFSSTKNNVHATLDHQKKLTLVTVQKPMRASSVRVFRPATAMPPYDKARYFEGRKEILEQIRRKLAKPERHRVVLLGSPGVG
jgi:hypothetical protein